MILLVYKIKHNLIKSNVLLLPSTIIHSHLTRNRDRVLTDRPRTELALRNVFYAGVTQYNSLPQNIRLEENILTFKRNLRKYIFMNLD